MLHYGALGRRSRFHEAWQVSEQNFHIRLPTIRALKCLFDEWLPSARLFRAGLLFRSSFLSNLNLWDLPIHG
jgi:hypothetical protein